MNTNHFKNFISYAMRMCFILVVSLVYSIMNAYHTLQNGDVMHIERYRRIFPRWNLNIVYVRCEVCCTSVCSSTRISVETFWMNKLQKMLSNARLHVCCYYILCRHNVIMVNVLIILSLSLFHTNSCYCCCFFPSEKSVRVQRTTNRKTTEKI